MRDGGAGAAESRLYYRLPLTGGEVCVLSYDLVPQWADKGRRDTLPDPQSLLFWSVGPPLVALIAGVAVRASRMLTRMMEPLVRAAEAVGRQDLDAPVEHSNVAQVDDVLQAMDKMRNIFSLIFNYWSMSYFSSSIHSAIKNFTINNNTTTYSCPYCNT